MSYEIRFVKEGRFNPYLFANLLLQAKGYRTMQEFAFECGTSPATFSRITNMVNKSASAPTLLQSIAANSDPSSGITLEMLAQANGYVIVYDTDPHEQTLSLDTARAQDVLAGRLLRAGNSVSIGEAKYQISLSTVISPDLLFITEGTNSSHGRWFIKLFVSSIEEHTYQGPITYKDRLSREVMRWFSAFSFISMSTIDDSLKPSRYSLVVFNEKEYDIIQREFQSTFVRDDISVILLDRENHHAYCEFALPKTH